MPLDRDHDDIAGVLLNRKQRRNHGAEVLSTLTLSSSLQPVAVGLKRKSGRVARDERGESVWEWQVATGVFQRDVTEAQIRELEAPDLQIVDASPAEAGYWIHDSLKSGAHVASPCSRARTRRRLAPARGSLRQWWARLRGIR